MKKTLFSLAAILCLLTIFVSSASCFITMPHRQSACDHCPKPAPSSYHATSCCTAHHQPVTAPSVAEAVQPAHPSPSVQYIPSDHHVAIALAISNSAGPPPFPPRIALRI